jgi:hypothetical protein
MMEWSIAVNVLYLQENLNLSQNSSVDVVTRVEAERPGTTFFFSSANVHTHSGA